MSGVIQKTPLVELEQVGRGSGVKLFAKCEFLGVTGSAEDRVVLHVLNAAEQRGLIQQGWTVVEAAEGVLGVSIAMVSSLKGYRAVIVLPDKTSHEWVAAIKAFGARVVLCPTAVDPEDPRSTTSIARRIAQETTNAFLINHTENADFVEAYAQVLGPEIWEQSGGELDVVVGGLESGALLVGVGKYLKNKKSSVRVVGVEPVGSVYSDWFHSGKVVKTFPYKLEGLGASRVSPLVDRNLIDEVVRVDDREGFLMAREIARSESLFVGGASGAVVAGALRYARMVNDPSLKVMVVVLPDHGAFALSTVFSDEWMRENGFLEDRGLGTVADLMAQRVSNEVIAAHPTDRIRDVIGRMKVHGISQLPVVEDGRPIGIISEVDLLRYLAVGEYGLDSPVGPLVEYDYATVSPRTSIESLQQCLANSRAVLVVEDGKVIAIITKIDLIDYLARRMG
ncbi:MAG: pyridoxal-phosphate dependent enzyme [Deltaproteobacteria bacterium]|nr:pyridoxal-phosphate dependent enzyme [Deltaproteobacteria bacterium]